MLTTVTCEMPSFKNHVQYLMGPKLVPWAAAPSQLQPENVPALREAAAAARVLLVVQSL